MKAGGGRALCCGITDGLVRDSAPRFAGLFVEQDDFASLFNRAGEVAFDAERRAVGESDDQIFAIPRISGHIASSLINADCSASLGID